MSTDRAGVAAIHAGIIGERNNIIIPRLYLQLTGWDYPAAVVLREVVYWSGDYAQTPERDGWFYRTAKDWESQFGLSWKQVTRAVAALNGLMAGEPLIERTVRKLRTSDGAVLNERATFYRLRTDLFERLVWESRNRPKGELGTRPEDDDRNRPKGEFLTLDTGDLHRRRSQGEGATRPAPRDAMPRHGDAQTLVAVLYEDVLGIGAPTNYRQVLGQAQQLVKAGVDGDEVRAIASWLLADPFWAKKGIGMGTVLAQRDNYRAARSTKTTALPEIVPGPRGYTAGQLLELARREREADEEA